MDQIVEEFLSHFGVKGQKWGVRRRSSSGVRGKKPGTRTHDATKLSNKDLKRVVDRMRLEQDYAKLNATNANKINNGKGFVSTVLNQTGMKVATTALSVGAGFAIGKLLTGDAASSIAKKLTS